eukprot:TRINITY_DN7651_c0_g1_i1.p1 TRINITY_DN7651_c0_g1~~TRINITY_DN7651_c0_g1_i1.p1  ORF type:complete len:572 (-),score=78.86 TRINITY_DN7651_c0_g1_i1:74-1552(-)
MKTHMIADNQCVVCHLSFDDRKDLENHVDECTEMMESVKFKGQVEMLKSATGRHLSEIMLVARHFDLLDHDQLTKAASILKEGIDVQQWKKKRKQVIVKKDCVICLDTYLLTDMFTVDCPSAHRFCRDCIQQGILASIGTKRICTCPALGCTHQITEMEVEQLFGKGKELEEYREIVLMQGLSKLPVVACPGVGCKNFIEMSNPNVPEKCICSCGSTFCSMCKQPFHYGMDCQQYITSTASWVHWIQTGRPNYHGRDEYQREKLRVEQRNKDLVARYNELVIDEQWKEQNCHACPHCGRPIQRLEGCDSMVCGSDYHGGNIQNGCGQSFVWTSALPYKSNSLTGATLETMKLDQPRDACTVNHGKWLPCDGCHKTIRGLRFQCVNCPSYNLCERCDLDDDIHEKGHDKNHIFQIIDKAPDQDTMLTIESKIESVTETFGKIASFFSSSKSTTPKQQPRQNATTTTTTATTTTTTTTTIPTNHDQITIQLAYH